MGQYIVTLRTDREGNYYVETKGISVKLAEDKQLRLKEHDVKNQPVILGVRPEHLTIAEKGINGQVEVSELMGSSLHLHMTVDGKDVICIVPTEGRKVNYDGKQLNLAFTGDVAHVFSKEDQHNLEY